MVLSRSLWRTSAVCRGTSRSNTSWPPPARAAEPQCGTSARTTSSLKSATTATEYVVRFAVRRNLTNAAIGLKKSILFSHSPLVLCAQLKTLVCVYFIFRCIALDWLGTQKWPLSWSWPRRTIGCQSSRCGTCVLLPLPSRF